MDHISNRKFTDKVTYNSTTDDLEEEMNYKEEPRGNELGELTSHHYACPECGKKLFSNRDKAADFLKQDDN